MRLFLSVEQAHKLKIRIKPVTKYCAGIPQHLQEEQAKFNLCGGKTLCTTSVGISIFIDRSYLAT